MQYRVMVAAMDDGEAVVWSYERSENVVAGADQQESALKLAAAVTASVEEALPSIQAQIKDSLGILPQTPGPPVPRDA